VVENMSEPVTNAEVEDVLSSIRRLVSEDKRPMQASGPGPEQDAATPEPAHGAAQDSAPEADTTVYSGDFSPHVPKSMQNDSIQDDVAAPEMPALTQKNTHTEERDGPKMRPFFSSRKPMNPPTQPTPPAAPEAAADKLVLTPALRVATSDGQDRPFPASDRLAKDTREQTPELEADTTASPTISPFDYDMLHDDPADRQAEDFGDARGNGDAQADRTATAPASEGGATDVAADEAFASVRFTPAEPTVPPRKLSDKIAALETAIGNISDNWEPDSPGDDDYSGTAPQAMVWEDDVELEAEPTVEFATDAASIMAAEPAEPEAPARRKPAAAIEEQVRRFADSGPRAPEPAARTSDAGADTAEAATGISVEDQFLDEEALRDLVTEIVRAELQGALGERITRNVRKLVRREIHRAMTAQDLE